MTNSSALNQGTMPPECEVSNFLGGQLEVNTGVYVVLVFAIILHSVTFPFTFLLNLLVIVAVKTKRRLQNTSNIAIACLAATDLMVGIVVQPLFIATSFSFLQGKTSSGFCTLRTVTWDLGRFLSRASILHLLLMCVERYLVIKHAYSYSTMATKTRTLIASGMVWIATMLLQIPAFVDNSVFIKMSVPMIFACLVPIIIVQFAIYRVTRRHELHIIAQQVTAEAKERLLKEKKALKIARIIILVVLICYLPVCIVRIVFFYYRGKLSPDIALIMFYLAFSLGIENSLINPIIYSVRIGQFRRAFVELLRRRKNHVKPKEKGCGEFLDKETFRQMNYESPRELEQCKGIGRKQRKPTPTARKNCEIDQE